MSSRFRLALGLIVMASLTITAHAPSLRAQEIASLKGNLELGFESLAYSPDGQHLAASGANMPIHIWETTNWQFHDNQFSLSDRQYSGPVAFAPDGHTLVVQGELRAMVLADIRTGAQTGKLEEGRSKLGTQAWSLVFTPDSRTLISAGASGEVFFWDIPARKLSGIHRVHTDTVNSLALAPDGNTLASAGLDYQIILWDVAKASEIKRFKHPRFVYSLAFSQAAQLAVAGHGSKVVIKDPNTGLDIRTFDTPSPNVFAVAYSSNNALLAAAGHNGMVVVWDLNTGNARQFTGHTGPVHSLCFSPDSKHLASASRDSVVKVWEVTPTFKTP